MFKHRAWRAGSPTDQVNVRVGVVIVMLACAVALLGCGSSGGGGSVSGSSERTSSTGAEALKSPGQILAGASAALKSAHGYVMSGTLIDDGRQMRLEVVAAGAMSLKLALSAGGAQAELIDLPGAAYIRANSAFWKPRIGARAATIANHWIQVPPTNTQGVTSSLGRFAPATLARCLAEDHGTLTVAARRPLTAVRRSC